MKRIIIALALAYAPVALALSDNDFCNGEGVNAGAAYRSGNDIDKQAPMIQGFIRNMRDGKAPNEMGAVVVMGFAKGYCLGWLNGARVGEQKGRAEEQKKNTF